MEHTFIPFRLVFLVPVRQAVSISSFAWRLHPGTKKARKGNVGTSVEWRLNSENDSRLHGQPSFTINRELFFWRHSNRKFLGSWSSRTKERKKIRLKTKNHNVYPLDSREHKTKNSRLVKDRHCVLEIQSQGRLILSFGQAIILFVLTLAWPERINHWIPKDQQYVFRLRHCWSLGIQ